MSGVSPRKNLGSLFCQSQMLFTLECWVGEQVGAVKTPPVCTVKGRYRDTSAGSAENCWRPVSYQLNLRRHEGSPSAVSTLEAAGERGGGKLGHWLSHGYARDVKTEERLLNFNLAHRCPGRAADNVRCMCGHEAAECLVWLITFNTLTTHSLPNWRKNPCDSGEVFSDIVLHSRDQEAWIRTTRELVYI